MGDSIRTVIEQLKDLFKDGGELKGFNDWDRFLGCIMMLNSIADEVDRQDADRQMESDTGEVVEDG